MFWRKSEKPKPEFRVLTDQDKSVVIQILKDKAINIIQNSEIIKDAVLPAIDGTTNGCTASLTLKVGVTPEELRMSVSEMLFKGDGDGRRNVRSNYQH